MPNSEVFNLELHHTKCFDALCKVDEIFKKHKIEYILLAGTTLGAIRHGGFIPWDDDIDIGVFREDVEKAARILVQELPEEFIYQDRKVVKNFPRLFGKIIDAHNGYGCIDIFPIIKTSDHYLGRRSQWTSRKILFKLYKAKIGYANDKEHAGTVAKIKLRGASYISKLVSMHTLEKMIDENERRFEKMKGNKYYVVLYGAHKMKNETIRASWIKPYSLVSFNDIQFPAVGNVDAYLTNMYGDYMTPPKDADRMLRHNESFKVD